MRSSHLLCACCALRSRRPVGWLRSPSRNCVRGPVPVDASAPLDRDAKSYRFSARACWQCRSSPADARKGLPILRHDLSLLRPMTARCLQGITSHLKMSLTRQNSLMECPLTLEPLSADTSSDAVPVALPCGHTLSRGAVRQVRIHTFLCLALSCAAALTGSVGSWCRPANSRHRDRGASLLLPATIAGHR